MSLVFSSHKIGDGWKEVPLGDATYTLDQWYSVRTREWATVPWFTGDGYACRSGQNLRRPVSFGAKLESIWSAKGKLFKRYILRINPNG